MCPAAANWPNVLTSPIAADEGLVAAPVANLRHRQGAQAGAQVGQADVELAGRQARGQQHRQLVLAHEVQQVEKGVLIADAGVQVLDQQRPGGAGHVRLA
jgi:hypothetical protein